VVKFVAAEYLSPALVGVSDGGMGIGRVYGFRGSVHDTVRISRFSPPRRLARPGHSPWIYYTAPVMGMLAAVEGFRLFSGRETHCAKLCHAKDKRCIHCGYEPHPDTTGTDNQA